jgi:hypothetical protein
MKVSPTLLQIDFNAVYHSSTLVAVKANHEISGLPDA